MQHAKKNKQTNKHDSTKTILPAQDQAMTQRTVYCFHPCAGVWFLVCFKSLVPGSNSDFLVSKVKGDTLLHVCIAGKTSWVLTCLIELALFHVTEHRLMWIQVILHIPFNGFLFTD